MTTHTRTVTSFDNPPLKFDNTGRSAAVSITEGIHINYECRIKDYRWREMEKKAGTLDILEELNIKAQKEKDGATVTVPPLIGVSFTAFDRFIGPYIALEE